MKFLKLKIETTQSGIDVLTGLLINLGVTGFEVEDPQDFSEFLEERPLRWDYMDESVMKLAGGKTAVTVYLPLNDQGKAMEKAARAAVSALGAEDAEGLFGSLRIVKNEVDDKSWENNWKQYLKPFPVGEKLLIKPSWEEYGEDGGRTMVEIDTSTSFGTGSHASTRLCLEALERLVHGGERVLDLGCGTGILGIAAMLLGAKSVTAADIEENAVKTARENALRNGIKEENFNVLCGNLLEDLNLCGQIGFEEYDLVAVNIVADVIIAMAPLIAGFLKPGGTVVTAGIIRERAFEVEDALRSVGLQLKSVSEISGWASVEAVLPKMPA